VKVRVNVQRAFEQKAAQTPVFIEADDRIRTYDLMITKQDTKDKFD
jgi:hypothetical protein